jgi:hypothetical protein
LLDLAAVDVGQDLAGQLELAGLDARDVDDRHDAAEHRRELDEAALLEVLALEGRVGGAEIDRFGLDLADAAARADRLVVQARAGFLAIGLGPFRIDREREGGAGAGDVGGRCGQGEGRHRQADDGHLRRVFHLTSPLLLSGMTDAASATRAGHAGAPKGSPPRLYDACMTIK